MTEPKSPLSLARVLSIVVPVAIVLGLAYWWAKSLEPSAQKAKTSNAVARMFTGENAPVVADLSYPDADNDLVADPPADESKLINPDTLVFSYVASQEEGPADDTWKELLAAIKEKTGKDVKLVHYTDVNEQLDALKKGELHIAGLNTGLVPIAVDRDGFVPLCTFGHADGTFGYTMEIIVPAGSPIKDPSQIKGHKVTFTRPDSNSGCKAPFVLLMQEYNLLPERDYESSFSQGHEDSIKQVAAKQCEVAPIASDVLARMVQKGEVDPAAVVSIYKSKPFPPATMGYVYNLTPALRDGIREVLLGFDWGGTGMEKEFGPDNTKFVPVTYKNDWADILRIDEAIVQARKAGGNGS